jgi:acetyltransferase-like isoleucine patch superfamily enzyme
VIKIKAYIKNNPRIKQIVHRLLIPKYQARPRWWVRNFLNPFVHKKGKRSTICKRVRMDVLPFSDFSIGDFSTIEDFSVVNNGLGAIYIGNHVRVGIGNVIIGPVTIGNNVIMAQNVVLSGLNHSYDDINIPIVDQQCTFSPIVIHEDCWIGANAVITSGVTIGKHAVVAAGSIVTKDVNPFTIVAGNPAKPIKAYNKETKSWNKL